MAQQQSGVYIPPFDPATAPRVGQRVGDTAPQAKPLTAADWDTAKPLTSSDWDSAKPVGSTKPQEAAGDRKPQGFFENLWAGVNPMPLIKMLGDTTNVDPKEAAMLRGAGAPPGMGNLIRGIVGAQQGEWQKAKEAYDKGNYGDAVMYALSTAAPVAGPTVTNFAETVKSGDYAGAAGQVVAVAGPVKLAKTVLPKVPVTPAMGTRNPVTASAVQFAEQRGIPVDAGTATGNVFVRGAQYAADRTVPGSIVAGKALDQQQAALTSTGRQLASDVHPAGPATPLSSGGDVYSAVSSEVSAQHAAANQAYTKLRTLEAANPQAFTVDMTPVKASLQPIYDRLLKQSTPMQQQVSKPLLALKNILEGPDSLPVSIADADLSAIKAMARTDSPMTRDISQGLASRAVVNFDAAVQRAVAQGGPDATAALMAGRKATRAKYLADDILDTLNEKEPVKSFDMMTAPRDTTIGKLRDLQKIAPQEIPKIGRAFLDDIIDTSTAEGGFQKAGSALAKWQNMGKETKNLLFSPAMQAELDNFFVLAKRAAETPNPSGTAGTTIAGNAALGILTNPIAVIGAQFPGYAISKLFRTPKGIKLLSQGFKINPNTVSQKAWLASVGAMINQDK